MTEKKIRRVFRSGRVSQQEADRLNGIRRQAMEDFPPAADRPRPATTGIGARIRAAREAKGLTWYAVAKLAGIPNPPQSATSNTAATRNSRTSKPSLLLWA